MAASQYNQDTRIEPLVDGMISLLQRNLIANTKLISDVSSGSTRIYVQNTLRFERGEQILIRDNKSVWSETKKSGLEFHTIADVVGTNCLELKQPLKKSFYVSDNARIQKTLKNIPLYPEDIYYGDRDVVTWESVAICIEPESMSPEWMATNGLLSTEYKMGIYVYVRMGGTADTKNLAMRVCNAYADAIHRLLIGNIHLDLTVDEVPLLRDANPGDDFVYISADLADGWSSDGCFQYEVQDNYKQEWDLALFRDPLLTSSSSESSLGSVMESSSSEYHSSVSSSSFSTNSVSTESSQSSYSTVETSSKSGSSSSSLHSPPLHKVWLSRPLYNRYRVRDKAVLRRKNRYLYDSRVTDIQYGMIQKGEILKAAHISWFGKETRIVNFPQVGKGGGAY